MYYGGTFRQDFTLGVRVAIAIRLSQNCRCSVDLWPLNSCYRYVILCSEQG